MEAPPHAPVGHNQPDFVQAAVDAVKEMLKPFEERKAQFLEAARKVVIRTRADAGSAGDLIGLARGVEVLIDEERARIVAPHDMAVKAVNGRANDFWQPVWDAMVDVKAKITTFAEEEDARVQAQAEEQRLEEARIRRERATGATELSLPPPAPPRAVKKRSMRGDLGFQVSVQDDDVIEIANWKELPDFIFEAESVREAIRKVVKPLVKQGVKVTGLKVTKALKTQIRR